MRRGSGINKGTDPEQSATQPLTLLPQKTQSKLQGVQGCLGGVQGASRGGGHGAVEKKSRKKNQKKTKARSRGSRGVWGGPGGSRGVQGVPGGVQGGPEVLGEKRLKQQKTRKMLRNCMASLLRSNIQDFVQEVPVGQMAQGTLFRCLPWPTPLSVQHATWLTRYIGRSSAA